MYTLCRQASGNACEIWPSIRVDRFTQAKIVLHGYRAKIM